MKLQLTKQVCERLYPTGRRNKPGEALKKSTQIPLLRRHVTEGEPIDVAESDIDKACVLVIGGTLEPCDAASRKAIAAGLKEMAKRATDRIKEIEAKCESEKRDPSRHEKAEIEGLKQHASEAAGAIQPEKAESKKE